MKGGRTGNTHFFCDLPALFFQLKGKIKVDDVRALEGFAEDRFHGLAETDLLF